MKKLITASDIRAARTRGEQEMSVVLRASIITPEAREAMELLGVTTSECEESASAVAVSVAVNDDGMENQHIRETITVQLPEGQFVGSLAAQLMDKVMKKKQPLEQGGMQPSFNSVTGRDGVKATDGSNVKFGRFDGARLHCVGLTDLVTDRDGSSMAAGLIQ